MENKKPSFPLMITLLVAYLSLFGIFGEDFSGQEDLPASYSAYAAVKKYNRCTFTVEVSGEAWLACVSTSRPHPDSLPSGVPTNYPTYQGVTPVPGIIPPQELELPRKMSDAEILLRVKNRYKEYCVISSWISYDIRPLSPPDCPDTAADVPKTKSRE